MSKSGGFLKSTLIASTAAGLILGAVAIGGQALAEPPPGAGTRKPAAQRCVTGDINRVTVLNERSILIVDDAGHSAVLTLSGPCLRDPSAQILLKLSPGVDSICHPNDADLEVNLSGTIQQTCRVTSVRQVAT